MARIITVCCKCSKLLMITQNHWIETDVYLVAICPNCKPIPNLPKIKKMMKKMQKR